MKNSDLFNISEFSENIFLIKLVKDSLHSHNSLFFLSLSKFFRTKSVWQEVISAEESIAVKYDSLQVSNYKAKDLILSDIKEFEYKNESNEQALIHVPVYYSEEFGLDIEELTTNQSISKQKLVDLHSGVDYEVKMIGFNPGFAYLGDLPEELRVSRLSKPRINLLPGSVGIAGNRTGIYPFGGPGGWRIIGRTPIRLFDKNKENPFLINPDMRVKFEPINKKQYESFDSWES